VTPTVLVDLIIVVLLVLAAWSGGRTGAARSAVSLLALILGLFISAQGQGAITSFVALLLPGVDVRLIGAGIFIGGVWILLAVASYVIGRILQASLRAIHLGAVDILLGALLGVVLWSAAIAAVIFIFDAAASASITLPAPIDGFPQRSGHPNLRMLFGASPIRLRIRCSVDSSQKACARSSFRDQGRGKPVRRAVAHTP
jgi:uncharacterized membrane protein required for colicin V production